MSNKYQRPQSSFSGNAELNNRDKYQADASAQPKIAISSEKMDGDFNYIIDALNEIDNASGSETSIAARLSKSLNDDGSLKAASGISLTDWIQDSLVNLNRVDNSTFTCEGDVTGNYVANRKVKLISDTSVQFAVVSNSTFSNGLTTVELVDIVNNLGEISVLSSSLMSVSYSPIKPGMAGNAVERFNKLYADELQLCQTMPLVILNDKGNSGKKLGIRSHAGALEVVENTAPEDSSPVYSVLAQINEDGFVIEDASLEMSKLEPSGVSAGTYSIAAITVNEQGLVTNAAEAEIPLPESATTELEGLVELATDAEVLAGTDASRISPVSALTQHKGIAKAWVNFNGLNTVSIRDSYNVSSITDLGTGYYRINLSINMANANYTPFVMVQRYNSNNGGIGNIYSGTSMSNTHYYIGTCDNGAGQIDMNVVSTGIFGDLA